MASIGRGKSLDIQWLRRNVRGEAAYDEMPLFLAVAAGVAAAISMYVAACG